METGEKFTVNITDMGNSGEGIGRADGITVFVPKAVPGDEALVEITQVKKNFARGKLTELIAPSPQRVEAACPHYGVCGGCTMQALSYEGQLQLKKKWVADRLVRIGGVEEPQVRDTIGMEILDASEGTPEEGEACRAAGPWRYRNKAQLPVGRVTGAEKKLRGCNIGFYRGKNREIADCGSCLLQAEPVEYIAQAVREYVKENKVPVYDSKTGTGVIRHVIVKTAFGSGEVMVILVATERRLPDVQGLTAKLSAALETLSDAINRQVRAEAGADSDEDYGYYLESLILNVNKKKTGEIMGSDCITLAGKPTIQDFQLGMTFEISPMSFYQVNPVQTEALYKKAAEYAGLTGQETVLDLYCGVGTIGLFLAKHAKRVIGIEAVKSAVLDANRNAVLNGIVNAEYICGRAEEELPRLAEAGVAADVVILDPPRAGCDAALLQAVCHIGPERIVYVSCDPATLARDVKALAAGGYELAEAQPVDMFPHTGSVETVCLLSKVV